MKFAALLAFVGCVVATRYATPQEVQKPMDVQTQQYPGFDLDLSELRLVQLEGQDPVWLSELDKVKHTHHATKSLLDSLRRLQINLKAQGVRFFDMCGVLALCDSSETHVHILIAPTPPTSGLRPTSGLL